MQLTIRTAPAKTGTTCGHHSIPTRDHKMWPHSALASEPLVPRV